MPESQINPRYSKYSNKEIEAILDSVAEFDDEPTEGSDRPVKSGGIAAKLSEKQDTLTFATIAECRSIVTGYHQQSQPLSTDS